MGTVLRRLLTFVVAVVVLAFLAAPAAHARPARDIAGVALHPWQLQNSSVRERVFAGVAATGAQWVRVDMPWNWVEERGPTVKWGHGSWGALDAVVNSADRHGLKVIGILGFTPRWASDSGDPWAYPYARPFEDFFTAALRRYPQIPAWELWNEPNFSRFSKPGPDPGKFVEFMRSARRVRDGVGSQAKLISGGLAPGVDIDIFTWLNEVAIRGGLSLIDGFGVHPYSVVDPDDPRSWMMKLETIHNRLAELGRPDLPLWLTEYGSPTTQAASGYGPPLNDQQQADRLRNAFALATRFDWIENLTWYEYRDSCDDALDPECNFGLVHLDLSGKPSYDAFREVIAGATAKLRPRLTLTSRIRAARLPARRSAARASKFAAPAKHRASKGPAAKHRASKRKRAKRRAMKTRTVNRITVSGALTLPGTPWPNAFIKVLLPRRSGPPKAVAIVVKEGYFWARFEGPELRSGTLEVRYSGSDVYQPLTAQVQVVSSATTKR